MSFCKSCGKELSQWNAFCTACGAAPVSSGVHGSPAGSAAGSVGVAGVASAPAMETNVGGTGVAPAQTMATNVAGALAYLAGFITGLIFLLVEPYKDNSVIRFHAYQSIFFNVAWFGFWMLWMVVSAILTPLTAGLFALIALPLILIISLAGFVYWVFLMVQAYQQKLYRIPFIGKYAAQQAGVKP
jgi:uncharacterized membrane protein